MRYCGGIFIKKLKKINEKKKQNKTIFFLIISQNKYEDDEIDHDDDDDERGRILYSSKKFSQSHKPSRHTNKYKHIFIYIQIHFYTNTNNIVCANYYSLERSNSIESKLIFKITIILN